MSNALSLARTDAPGLLAPASRAALPFVAPALLLMGLVILVPAIYVLWLSFHSSTFGVSPTFVGWDNYAKILQDPYFWRSLVNTAVIVLVVVHAELLLGLAMAALFAGGLPGRKVLIAVRAGAIRGQRGRRDRDVAHPVRPRHRPGDARPRRARAAAARMGRDAEPRPRDGGAAQRLAAPAVHLPHPLRGAAGDPDRLYEAARIDGASPWQTFRRVTLPLLVPAMLVAMLFRYIFAFRLFSEVWLLTGAGRRARPRWSRSTSTSRRSATTSSASPRPPAG